MILALSEYVYRIVLVAVGIAHFVSWRVAFNSTLPV